MLSLRQSQEFFDSVEIAHLKPTMPKPQAQIDQMLIELGQDDSDKGPGLLLGPVAMDINKMLMAAAVIIKSDIYNILQIDNKYITCNIKYCFGAKVNVRVSCMWQAATCCAIHYNLLFTIFCSGRMHTNLDLGFQKSCMTWIHRQLVATTRTLLLFGLPRGHRVLSTGVGADS